MTLMGMAHRSLAGEAEQGHSGSVAGTAITRGSAPSSKDSVCTELRDRKVKFFSYSYMNALPAFDIRNGPARGLDALDGMAKIDLNNDGNLLNVVRLEHPYCRSDVTTSLLAVTDETRTKIPESRLNEVLIGELTGAKPCGLILRAFSVAGTTYIDADRVGDHMVYEIRQGRASKVCSTDTFEIDSDPENE